MRNPHHPHHLVAMTKVDNKLNHIISYRKIINSYTRLHIF